MLTPMKTGYRNFSKINIKRLVCFYEVTNLAAQKLYWKEMFGGGGSS